VPHPLTDQEWDGWLVHQFGHSMICQSTTPKGQFPMEADVWSIDSKAMRKIGEDDVFIGVFEVGVIQGTFSADFQANTRFLSKLP